MAMFTDWIMRCMENRLRRTFAFLDTNPPLRYGSGEIIDLTQLIGRHRGSSK